MVCLCTCILLQGILLIAFMDSRPVFDALYGERRSLLRLTPTNSYSVPHAYSPGPDNNTIRHPNGKVYP